MVMRKASLDLVFSALSDPTRRGMLEALSRGEATAGALGKPFNISQPAISKHLRVLEKAGLIRRTRRGREHHIQVDPRPIQAAVHWIEHYAKFWTEHFDAVGAYLKARQDEAQGQTPSHPSPPQGGRNSKGA